VTRSLPDPLMRLTLIRCSATLSLSVSAAVYTLPGGIGSWLINRWPPSSGTPTKCSCIAWVSMYEKGVW
jgi:hypothetical protein